MSQRECAGLNGPPFSIPAEEPVSISPETVSRAGAFLSISHTWRPSRALVGAVPSLDPSLWSRVVGVGHPASAVSAGRAPPVWFGPPLLPSVARGVFRLAEPHALLPGSLQWILRMLDVAHSCGAVADSHGIPVFIP